VPFTFAHPAAVLPLRRHLWFPGLAVGSMAPDIVYYLPVLGGPATTHSVAALGVDLALGLVLTAIGYLVLAPLLALFPAGWRARVAPPDLATQLSTWRARVIAAWSVVVGAATHLARDAITQTNGAAVRHWPELRLSVVGSHRLYNVIGYVSSLGGLLLLGVVATRWYRHAPRDHGNQWRTLPNRVRRWVLGVLTAAAVGRAAIAFDIPMRRVSSYDLVRHVLIGGVQGAGLVLALYVLCWHLTRTLVRTRRLSA